MDTTTDITAAVPVATIDAVIDAFDKKGGVSDKAEALKHLTEILLNEFDYQFAAEKGKPGQLKTESLFTVSKSTLETMSWVVSQVWVISSDLNNMVGEICNDLVPLSNASYAARTGTAPVKAGA